MSKESLGEKGRTNIEKRRCLPLEQFSFQCLSYYGQERALELHHRECQNIMYYNRWVVQAHVKNIPFKIFDISDKVVDSLKCKEV